MMKKLITFLSILMVPPVYASGCSTFALIRGETILVCNNDDWFCNVAYFVVSPRGITKQTFLPSADKRLEWTSKYGSVTINFNFVGSPSGGMNEAGLVIDESWPGPCRYPDPDARPAIDEIQWLQYQFDNCATVDEVIQTDLKLRIVGFFGKSHYFVCDKNGKAATIEWIDGKMVVHILTGDNVPVLTNDNYGYSITQLKKYQGFGGDMTIGNSPSSLDRFCRAANMVRQFGEKEGITEIDYGFSVLANIAQQNTEFSWVYDINNLTICYKTAWNKEIKEVPLNKFDFTSEGPLLMTDILTTDNGDITYNFEPYTLEKNRDFVARVVENWQKNRFAQHITEAEIEMMIQYPETQGIRNKSSILNMLPGFPVLKGSYLGQQPPGLKAEPFAPTVFSVSGKNHHTLSFSDDGNELYFSRYPEHVTWMMRQVNGIWQPPMSTPISG
jgi:penicillin V acylase-like amidase (Ntn superfamily)